MSVNKHGLLRKQAIRGRWISLIYRYGLILTLMLTGMFVPWVLTPSRHHSILFAVFFMISALIGSLVLEALRHRIRLFNLMTAGGPAAVARADEWRCRTLPDAIPLLIWQCNANAKCDHFNQSWLQFTGRTMDQEVGDGWIQGVHPDDARHVMKAFLDAFERREAFQLEYRLRHHSGDYRWILDPGVPRFGPDGQFLGYVGGCIDITDRKRAEEALSESEARLKLAQQAGHVGVFDWDMIANRAVWTPELDVVFGLAPGAEEGTYENWVKFVHPEDLIRINLEFDQCIQARRRQNEFEYRILRPDGQIRWVEVKGQISYLDDGRPARIVGTIADLTERRRVEGALRQSETKFRVLAENARASFGIVQGQRFVYANPYFAQVSGYSVEELLTMDFPQLVHPESLPMMLEKMRRRYMGETAPGHYDFAMLTKSGEKRWVEFSVASIEYQGQPSMIGTGFDVTERKRAEQALREYADGLDFLSGTATRMLGALSLPELYRFVAERIYSLADGAVVMFSEFDVRNRKAILRELRSTPEEREAVIRMLGREPEGIVFDFLEETRKRIVPGGLALIEGGLCELTFNQLPSPLCAQIERALNLGDLYAMACAFGEDLLGLVAVATHERGPVRNKKLIESLVNQAALALKRKRVEEELRQANERLTAANTALAEADRRKDEFLAMLAHELRNPLAPVRNAVQILHLKGGSDPAIQRHREIIDRQITHMARLLDDLLDVSRVTRGKITLVRQRLRLADVLAHAVEIATPIAEARGHTLHVTFPPDDLRVEGDIDRLAQIFGNLLTNAVKYTDEGGQIWLEGRREEEQAVIRVRDTGMGITPEMLPQVFDLFAQADQTLGRSRGGLGIGLTMVKRLVEMHGGSVEVHSEGFGKGSAFTVRLPALAVLPEAHPVPVKLTPYEAGYSTELKPRRILVVDDVADTADSLAELLGLWGYQVRTAHNGPAALESARAFHPEVVLMDIGMPGMDGFEVTRHLRAEYGFGIVLVALTGYGQEEVRRQAEQAGFNQHLTKPVDLAALQSILEHAA